MANDWKSILLKLMCCWVVLFPFINPFNIQNVSGVDESCRPARLRGSQSRQDCSGLCSGPEVPPRAAQKVWFISFMNLTSNEMRAICYHLKNSINLKSNHQPKEE